MSGPHTSSNSHEMPETFNNPFVNNATPWWLAPNLLETGDVIVTPFSVIGNARFASPSWHPQTEALLPWFAGVTPSKAIHGAYSYPDITALTMANVFAESGLHATTVNRS